MALYTAVPNVRILTLCNTITLAHPEGALMQILLLIQNWNYSIIELGIGGSKLRNLITLPVPQIERKGNNGACTEMRKEAEFHRRKDVGRRKTMYQVMTWLTMS